MALQCPRCSYETDSGADFVDHLLTYHKDKAVRIFLKFIAEGKIKIEVA